MGNKQCCNPKQNPQFQKKAQYQPPIESKKPNLPKQQSNNICPPALSPAIKNHLQKYQPLKQFLPKYPQFRQFGDDVYEGSIDEATINGVPDGYGKMYKNDGCLFIGRFVNGVAEGTGVYIMPDGTFAQGIFAENCLNCQKAIYQAEDVEYAGGFKNNQFHGKGLQVSSSHRFQGVYEQGQKKNGRLEWQFEPTKNTYRYFYEGAFDRYGQFTGYGRMRDPKGLYTGEFIKGKKHGKGLYEFDQGYKYDGYYFENRKQGQGILYDDAGNISFKGQFQNDLPHGKGLTFKNGKQVEATWVNGVDQSKIAYLESKHKKQKSLSKNK